MKDNDNEIFVLMYGGSYILHLTPDIHFLWLILFVIMYKNLCWNLKFILVLNHWICNVIFQGTWEPEENLEGSINLIEQFEKEKREKREKNKERKKKENVAKPAPVEKEKKEKVEEEEIGRRQKI